MLFRSAGHVDKIHAEIINYNLPVKILKTLLPSSILATCPAHLNLLDLIDQFNFKKLFFSISIGSIGFAAFGLICLKVSVCLWRIMCIYIILKKKKINGQTEMQEL